MSTSLQAAIIANPLTASPETPLAAVVALMSEARSCCNVDAAAQAEVTLVQLEARASCVLIVEDKKVVGILTERDVVRLCAYRHSLTNVLSKEVMTAAVLTLREAQITDFFSVVTFLQQHHIRHIPVVNDQDCLVGLMTHETLRQVILPTDLLRLRLVQEVMTRTVLTAAPTDSLLAVAQCMASNQISSVVVIDPPGQTDIPIPVGLITERDLVQFQALGLDFVHYPVSQVMRAPVITVLETETLVTVQHLMEHHRIRRVVVVGPRKELRGIITQTNLLQAVNPLELYKLTEVLEARVKQLETEKLEVLSHRNLELERQVIARTENLHKQLQREQVIAYLATQIRASLSLQTILETAVAKIHQIFACDRVTIWKFNPDFSVVAVAEATQSPHSLLGERVQDECYQPDQHDFTHLFSQSTVRVVPDIYTTVMTDCHRELLIRLHTRAKVLVPLFRGSQIWGLLNITESQRARDWQEDEIDLLRNLADQLTIAIQQASILEQLQAELQERQQAETYLQIKSDLLAKVASQERLTNTLNHVCLAIEGVMPGSLCSILLLDQTNHLRDGAAPSLPATYRHQIDGILVGEGVGSCGTAVHRREKVIVADIANDPLWKDFQAVALDSGLRACWSTPIVAADHSILGTFAVYYPQVRSPRPNEMAWVESIAHIVMLAIQRHQNEIALKQSNQRLQEAQRIAQIGNWELNLQDNTLYWSEEVFRLFEVDPLHYQPTCEAFVNLIHPDDRAAATAAYCQHLQDRQPYSLVHRIPMPDGRIKYTREQCESFFAADGTPLLSSGTIQDVTDQKEAEVRRDRAEAALRQVIEGTSPVTGEAFFPALVRHMAEALRVRYAGVAQATPEGFQVLAFVSDGQLHLPSFIAYDAAPCCSQSLREGSCCHPSGVQSLYPDNPLLTDLQVEGYLGVRLHNAAGDPIGNLSVFHDAPLADPEWAQTLLTIFAARAGAELERVITAQALERLNTELESRVVERTAALAEREAFLQDFLDNANDLIQMVNIDTWHFEFVNRAWRDALGYSATEVECLTLFDVLAPDCLDHCQEVMEQMRAGTLTHAEQVELTFAHKSGRPVLVEGSINCRVGISPQGQQRTLSTRAIFRDVTAKKAAEQELKRREARYRALMDGASDAILLANPEGYFIEVNHKAVDLFGYPHHELVGLHFTQIHPPASLPKVVEAFAALARRESLENINLEILRRDGQTIPVDITGSVIEVEGETIIQGIFHDIRERMQAEQALRESELLFRRVFEAKVVGMMFTDFSGQITDANDRFLDIIGYSRADLEAQRINWAAITPPDYEESDQRAITHLQRYGEILPWEKEYLRPDGSRVAVLIGVALLSPLEGRCVAVVVDISDRKRYEIALKDSQQLLQTVLDTVPLSVFWKDWQSVILGCNQAFATASGWASPVDMIGKADAELGFRTAEVEGYAADDLAVMTSGIAQLGREETITPAGGSQRWVETNKLPLRDGAGTIIGIVGTFQDITDRKQAEAALRESEEKFRQLAEVVDAVFWILHLNRTDRVYVSPAYERIWGRPCTELYVTPDAWVEMIHPNDRERVVGAIPKQIQGTFDEEYRIIRPDGSLRWIRDRAFPIRNAEGQIYRLAGIAEDITDRKHNEEIIHQQAVRETVLREISQRIRESLDLQTIFDTACDEIRACLQADRVGIFKFYPDSGYDDGEFVAESVIDGLPSVVSIHVHDHCFGENYANLYARGRYFVADNIYQNGLTPCHTNVLSQFQVQANLVMPLICNHELWGLLCIHHCAAPRQWHPSEIDLGQQLANQLAIAIQQAILYDHLQAELKERQRAEGTIIQQLRQQTALELILQQIRQSLDLSEILAIVTQQVQELLQCDRVIVFRVSQDGHSQIVEEAVAPNLPSLKSMGWEDECWSEDVLQDYWQGLPRIVPDVMNDTWTDCLVEYSQAGQIQSKIVAPILQELHKNEAHCWVSPAGGDKLWGVLVVHACHSRRVWHLNEAQLLQQIANQLAIAIQQSHLFDQVQQELKERQLAEQQLTQRNEELIRATRLKDEFLANMSHELRTPLNAILGMTEGLQDEVFGTLNAQQMKALTTIERSGSHLLALINDVLDVAKIESGQVELVCAPTAIAPLCQFSIAFIKQQALKKQIHLSVNVPLNLPDITLDERRIRQVLINLLNNAVKFTPTGGKITLEITVTQPVNHQTQGYLCFAVKDTGIGISPENITKLFQPFVQIDSALNRQYQGTGLGLALTKRIVELHGGRVGLTSELGVGSCFTIELPYQASVIVPQGTAPEVLINPDHPISPSVLDVAPLLLFAEDNEANISTISSYLMAKGYRLEFAKNGQEAINQAVALTPDLILMDIQMPGMDGLEAMQRIRAIPQLQALPIIALTALAMEGDRERCIAAGATDYMAKPVKLKQLAERIQSLLAIVSKGN